VTFILSNQSDLGDKSFSVLNNHMVSHSCFGFASIAFAASPFVSSTALSASTAFGSFFAFTSATVSFPDCTFLDLAFLPRDTFPDCTSLDLAFLPRDTCFVDPSCLVSPWILDPCLVSPWIIDPCLVSPWIIDPCLVSPWILDPCLVSPWILDPCLVSPWIIDPCLGSPWIIDPCLGSPWIIDPCLGSPSFGLAPCSQLGIVCLNCRCRRTRWDNCLPSSLSFSSLFSPPSLLAYTSSFSTSSTAFGSFFASASVFVSFPDCTFLDLASHTRDTCFMDPSFLASPCSKVCNACLYFRLRGSTGWSRGTCLPSFHSSSSQGFSQRSDASSFLSPSYSSAHVALDP